MENEGEIGQNRANLLIRESGYFKNLTTTISIDDHRYCKEHGLKFNVLIQERIAQLRAIESGAIVENVTATRERLEKVSNRLQQALDFINSHGLIDKYIGDSNG